VAGVNKARLRYLSGPALVLALTSSAGAQQPPPPLDLAAITVDKEPQHKVVFANESVRVIEARFRPGSMSLKHAHAADPVTIMLTPGRDDPESVGRPNSTRPASLISSPISVISLWSLARSLVVDRIHANPLAVSK
jgi:hypothetical protein